MQQRRRPDPRKARRRRRRPAEPPISPQDPHLPEGNLALPEASSEAAGDVESPGANDALLGSLREAEAPGLLSYAAQAAELEDPAQELVAELLDRLLRVEGPPVEPIEGFSEGYRRELVRNLKGRIVGVAAAWSTGPWRCLLLEAPSVAMGRPVFLPRRELGGKSRLTLADVRVVTDSRSRGAMQRIVAACRALDVALPIGEGVVAAAFGTNRTFIAWRPREAYESFNADLRGDVDNLAKIVLDGLQSANVLLNDRGVCRLIASKPRPTQWASPPLELDEVLRTEITRRSDQGEDLETIRADLRLSRAHMARLTPNYKVRRGARPKDPARDAFLARQAAESILRDHVPYLEARRATGAPAAPLKAELAKALRQEVLDGQLDVDTLAERLRLDPRTAARIFSGDDEAARALRARKPRSRQETRNALERAANDVLEHGTPATQAARIHHVSLGSLRSRLARARKRTTG